MSDICKVYNYQGLAENCVSLLQRAKALMLTDPGTTQSKAAFVSLAGNKAIVAAESTDSGMTGVLLNVSRGYTNNTDDIEENTSNLNYTEKTQDPLPRMEVLATISACDYKTLFDADGKPFDIQLILNDNLKMGTNQDDGTVKGFRGRIAVKFGLPPSDNAANSYMIRIYFDDVEEFKDFYLGRLETTVTQIKDAVPVGIDLSLNTAYAAGDIILKALKRCTNTLYTGGFATTAKWEVIGSNVDTPAITVVSESAGLYTLTAKKGAAPANLAAGDYIDVQGKDSATGFFTYTSTVFRILGV